MRLSFSEYKEIKRIQADKKTTRTRLQDSYSKLEYAKLGPRGKTERQELIDAADDLWGERVLMRDRCCQLNPTIRVNLHPHHIFSRSNFATRWVLKNGIALAAGNHYYQAHKFPAKFRKFIIGRMGQAEYDRLEALSNTHIKCDKEFILKAIKELQEI